MSITGSYSLWNQHCFTDTWCSQRRSMFVFNKSIHFSHASRVCVYVCVCVFVCVCVCVCFSDPIAGDPQHCPRYDPVLHLGPSFALIVLAVKSQKHTERSRCTNELCIRGWITFIRMVYRVWFFEVLNGVKDCVLLFSTGLLCSRACVGGDGGGGEL